MFHLTGWFGTTPAAVQTAFDLPPLPEPNFHIQNSHVIIPKPMNLLLAWAGAAAMTQARFNSGSIRQVNPLYILPPELAVLPSSNGPLANWLSNPFRIVGPEELVAETGSSNAAGEKQKVLAWLTPDQITPIPSGPEYLLKFTSTTAAVIDAWTQLAIAFETSLPLGNYAVIGCEMFSTNLVAFRMIFDNMYWRPGALGKQAVQHRQRDVFFDGSLGLWGVFSTISLPRIEVLCNVADVAYTGWLKVVRTNIVPPGYVA